MPKLTSKLSLTDGATCGPTLIEVKALLKKMYKLNSANNDTQKSNLEINHR